RARLRPGRARRPPARRLAGARRTRRPARAPVRTPNVSSLRPAGAGPQRPERSPIGGTTMGSGRWSTDVYDAATRMRAATGASAFGYSDSGARVVHDRLNPFGVTVRESRDSDEHPTSLAIAVLFDVTGSMRNVPRVLQAKLPGLLGLLLRKGYADDPQILFGAIGDATCDRVPLQVGQFESDNRMDEDLG